MSLSVWLNESIHIYLVQLQVVCTKRWDIATLIRCWCDIHKNGKHCLSEGWNIYCICGTVELFYHEWVISTLLPVMTLHRNDSSMGFDRICVCVRWPQSVNICSHLLRGEFPVGMDTAIALNLLPTHCYPNQSQWLYGEKRNYSFNRTCCYATLPFCLLTKDFSGLAGWIPLPFVGISTTCMLWLHTYCLNTQQLTAYAFKYNADHKIQHKTKATCKSKCQGEE
jgi:hypothetical protein